MDVYPWVKKLVGFGFLASPRLTGNTFDVQRQTVIVATEQLAFDVLMANNAVQMARAHYSVSDLTNKVIREKGTAHQAPLFIASQRLKSSQRNWPDMKNAVEIHRVRHSILQAVCDIRESVSPLAD